MSCDFRVSRLWGFTVLGFQGYGILQFYGDMTRPGYPPRIFRVVPPSEVPLYNP